ncbi:MAG: Flp family type IVb pilin, partial [Desulfobaccales bacterium]
RLETGIEFALLTFQPLRDTKKEGTVEKLGNLCKEESGAAAVEYALLLAFIALVIITAVAALGTKVTALYQMATNSFPGA